ncbi:MAG: hypothetical protein JWO05_3701 [Gemmatimonadetes bacterium]|nr:hypothetical protein [Gemmatimonadota bacterium]
MTTHLIRILALAALASCGFPHDSTAPATPLDGGGRHLLFIGNSFTYVNDLPRTVADLAASAGDTIRVKSVALPDYAVIDHALGGSNAASVIRAEHWDVVLLQQGPTPAGLDRDTLVLAAKIFAPLATASGARTAALMTWPGAQQQLQYPSLFDETRDSCMAEASAVSGVCYPAGEAWRAAWKADPQLALYGGDGYHPSPLGTYLTALVIYEEVTGHDARTLPSRATVAGAQLSASETTVRLLQAAAHEVVTRYR